MLDHILFTTRSRGHEVSSGVTLKFTDVEAQTWTVVTGFSSIIPPSSTVSQVVTWTLCHMFGGNVNIVWQLSWKYISVGSESMQQHFLFFFCFCSIHPSSSTSLCGAYVTHHAPWPLTVQSLASQAICPVFRSSPGATNPTSIYPLSKPSISSWEIGKDSLRCHQSVTEVTNTDTQTHSHPQAICVSPFHLFCLSVVCGRKPTHTHREHETCRLRGDRTNHRAAAPCWHLTWASVVKSKCISPPALCTSTLPLSTAPFQCQTAAWSCLSPAHLWWKNTLLSRHRKAFICILKHAAHFTKFHAYRMKFTK